MNYVSQREQIQIYFGKFSRQFKNTKSWYSFISTLVIILVACLVSGNEGFKENLGSLGGSGIQQTSFIIICACIWIGLFNSITLICKERDIIKHEYRNGMRLSAYVAAHMLFQALISLVQALIVTGVVTAFYHADMGEGGYSLFRGLGYFITIFLVIFATDTLGLLVSSVVKTVEQAMMAMPFVILLQFLFSGQISLDDLLKTLTNLMVSRFGLDAFLSLSGARNSMWPSDPYPAFICWIMLIIFTAIFAYLAVYFLKSVEKDTRD